MSVILLKETSRSKVMVVGAVIKFFIIRIINIVILWALVAFLAQISVLHSRVLLVLLVFVLCLKFLIRGIKWRFRVFMLIYLGGIIILILYCCAISEEKFHWVSPHGLWRGVFLFLGLFSRDLSSFRQSSQFLKFYLLPGKSVFIFLLVYLLLALVLVVLSVNPHWGSLKFFKL